MERLILEACGRYTWVKSNDSCCETEFLLKKIWISWTVYPRGKLKSMKLLTCKINNWIFKGQKLSPLNVSRPTRAKKKAEVICFFFVRLRSKYKVKSQKGSSDAAITLFQHKAWHPSNSLSSCYFRIITNANKINSGLTAPLLRFFFSFFRFYDIFKEKKHCASKQIPALETFFAISFTWLQ